jgi:hypothetical protein
VVDGEHGGGAFGGGMWGMGSGGGVVGEVGPRRGTTGGLGGQALVPQAC